jgi:hypothetical protein
MKQQYLIRTEYEEEREPQPQAAAPRSNIELDWTESEWFEVWLELAREGQKGHQNSS